MKTNKKQKICLFLHIHQPFRLKAYRFFNIGQEHAYFDEVRNKHIIKRLVHNSYLPAAELFLYLIRKYGSAVQLTFGVSGTALEQFERYTPWMLDSLQKLYKTGNVEFVAEPYASSLALLGYPDEYKRQIETHVSMMQHLLGCRPKALMNTSLLYADQVAAMAHYNGFKTVLTEGASQVLGWRSPNYVYESNPCNDVRLLLRNCNLSNDINFNFSDRQWQEWPLTAEKMMGWLGAIPQSEEVVNLFIDAASIGEYHEYKTGIFDFFERFIPNIIQSDRFEMSTVSDAAGMLTPISKLPVERYISCADQEKDLSSWLSNEIQLEAYNSLYANAAMMINCNDKTLLGDWDKLQTCDHFYYMCTKQTGDAGIHQYFSPYSSPFEAFLNYMNVITDFTIRIKEYTAKKQQSLRFLPLNKREVPFTNYYNLTAH